MVADDDVQPPEPAPLPGFEVLRGANLPWSEQITRDDYGRRWLTVSTFLAATDDRRAELVAQVLAVLDEHPDTRGRDRFTLAQTTAVHLYRRVGTEVEK